MVEAFGNWFMKEPSNSMRTVYLVFFAYTKRWEETLQSAVGHVILRQ
jgi:hypothetical protein